MAVYGICRVYGCGKPIRTQGLCGAHRTRLLRRGDVDAHIPLRGPRKKCAVDGCNLLSASRGYCQKHYKRFMLYGDATAYHPDHKKRERWIEANKSYAGDDCLPWPFSMGDNGRGVAWLDGRQTSAPHAMCTAAHGPRPSEAHEAAHSCGSGHEGCVNPRHLRWATRLENAADRDEHGRTVRGVKVNTNILTEDQVREIRRRRKSETGVSLAREFGVTAANIAAIHKRKTWAWLED